MNILFKKGGDFEMKTLFLKFSCLLTVLIIAVLLGCGGDDKPTEQPPVVNFDDKRATIYAFVHDQDGQGINGATVISVFYFGQPNFPSMLLLDTRSNGMCTVTLAVRNEEGKDTVSIYATMWNEGIFSDTIRLHVENDWQEFNVDFELNLGE